MLSSLASAAGLARPKKKFHFDVKIKLEELLNCTFLTGDIFAKIRLREGGTFSALSKSCAVHSHTVKWDQKFEFHCKMYASPVTGELETCQCKISVRKESKGGRSYKKLGYIKINLAEYAGAGDTRKKYLLESYNENKHKPDNSILQLTIMLKQTSGDSLFKVPQAAPTGQEWEFIENSCPTDEGIQPDIQSGQARHSFSSEPPVSNAIGTFNLEGVSAGNGGSLQDMRRLKDTENGDIVRRERKTSSASNLRGLAFTDVSISEEPGKPEGVSAGVFEHPPLPSRHPLAAAHKTSRSSSFNHGPNHSSLAELPPSAQAQHRRLGSWSQVGGSHTSPHPSKHRRQQSLVSGQSSKSTSAYSTLSERSGGSVEGPGDGDSISGSLRGKLTVLPTSSRVEQSRVDPQAVINNLFSAHTFESTMKEGEESEEGGLKIFVDKNSGTVTVTGTNLDRKNTNLQAINVSEHKSSSPRRIRKKSSSHSTTNRDSAGQSFSHEQSPPPFSSQPHPPHTRSSRSTSPSSTTSTITATR